VQYALLSLLVSSTIGLLTGVLIGYVLRSSGARKEVSSVQDQLVKAREQLAHATISIRPEGDGGKARHWTGTEIAAVVTAVGGFIVAFLTTYHAISHDDVKEQLENTKASLSAVKHARDAAQASLATIQSEATQLLHYDLKAWQLPTKKGRADAAPRRSFAVNGMRIEEINCGRRRPPLEQSGDLRPSDLTCLAGDVQMTLKSRTRFLIIPLRNPDPKTADDAAPRKARVDGDGHGP
jgi:uncharacterized membrane-anchored protein YhcB (DUF1043 family)